MKFAATVLYLLLGTIGLFGQLTPVCGASGGSPVPFQTSDGKWGYLSRDGIVVPPRFDTAAPFTKDGAMVCNAGQCALINTVGAVVALLPQVRRGVGAYSEGVAAAINEHDEWGFVDYAGKVVIPFQFSFAGNFDSGMALVRRNEKAFFIDRAGDRVTPEFDSAFDFAEGLAAVEMGGKFGFIRRDGSLALPPMYKGASGIVFSEGLVVARVGGKVGFMDTTGAIVIKPAFDDAYPFSEGLAAVQAQNKWGYIDKAGQVVVPIRFHIAHTFSEGVASVELDGKWGYINHAGAFVIPQIFDSAMPFCSGVAEVESYRVVGQDRSHGCRAEMRQGKNGFINHSGNYVWRDSAEHTWTSPFCF